MRFRVFLSFGGPCTSLHGLIAESRYQNSRRAIYFPHDEPEVLLTEQPWTFQSHCTSSSSTTFRRLSIAFPECCKSRSNCESWFG